MSTTKKIRTSIGNYLYKRELARLRRTVKAIDLAQVKTAGIIFEADNEANLKHVRELRKQLPPDAQVTAVGYINKKRENFSYISDKVYNYISEEDFGFFMRPKTESIKEFLKTKIDILFVLSHNYLFAIDQLTGLSNASFKVGQTGAYEKNLDFFIDTGKNDLNYLISQIVFYLDAIKTR
ncbi:MAG: hypothetical protein LBV41_01415 [Cytophagaceae bacterium]|jgi:hypothetical protein|nr:hypothetical protein [Cytophagaceae bacterium]